MSVKEPLTGLSDHDRRRLINAVVSMGRRNTQLEPTLP
jgi:hypothetical protein